MRGLPRRSQRRRSQMRRFRAGALGVHDGGHGRRIVLRWQGGRLVPCWVDVSQIKSWRRGRRGVASGFLTSMLDGKGV